MSDCVYKEGQIDFEKPTVAVCTFYEQRFLYEGMWQFPIALASSDGHMAYLPLQIKTTSANALSRDQANNIKASIETFRMLTDGYNVVCYDAEEVIKIIGDFFRPGTPVYCVKSELAKAIGEYENGQLKTFSQHEAVERIGYGHWQESHPCLDSAVWVLQAFYWSVENGWGKKSPSFQ
jgi:hypothetical protein